MVRSRKLSKFLVGTSYIYGMADVRVVNDKFCTQVDYIKS